jgi:hypothetical protein
MQTALYSSQVFCCKIHYHKNNVSSPYIHIFNLLKSGLFLLNVFTDPFHTILEAKQNKLMFRKVNSLITPLFCSAIPIAKAVAERSF